MATNLDILLYSPSFTRRALRTALVLSALYLPCESQAASIPFDAGFNSSSQACGSYLNNSARNRWLCENGKILSAYGALPSTPAPLEGDGVLRMGKARLQVTQARQRINIPQWLAGERLRGTLSGHMAASEEGIMAQMYFESNNEVDPGIAARAYSQMRVNQGWQRLDTSGILAPNAKWIEPVYAGVNSTMSATDFVFADDTALEIERCAIMDDAPALVDGGLNSDAQSCLSWFSFTPGRWSCEIADIGVSGPVVQPFEGDGFMRLRNGAGFYTQALQRMDLSAQAAAIDTGEVRATFSVYMNSVSGGLYGGANIFFYDQAGALISSRGSAGVLNATPQSWTKYTASARLPVGTRSIDLQVAGQNESFPTDEHFYVDNAEFSLERCTDIQQLCKVSGSVGVDNHFLLFSGRSDGSDLNPLGQGTGNLFNSQALGFEVDTEDADYLYLVAWSDDFIWQGALLDLQMNNVHIDSGSNDIEVYPTRAGSFDTFADLPSATAVEQQILAANQASGWVPTAKVAVSSLPGNVFDSSLHSLYPNHGSLQAMWYDSKQQSGSRAPFAGGFDHGEYLIFRIPLDKCTENIFAPAAQTDSDSDLEFAAPVSGLLHQGLLALGMLGSGGVFTRRRRRR